jgi:hypothetical protein
MGGQSSRMDAAMGTKDEAVDQTYGIQWPHTGNLLSHLFFRALQFVHT